MYRVPIDAIKPGMKAAKGIYTSDGQILINAGVTLKPRYIDHLRKLGIAAIYVEDNLAADVVANDIVDDATRLEATKAVKEFFVKTQQSGNGSSIMTDRKLQQTVNNIIDDLLSKKDLMINLQDIRTMDDYTFGHSVNVCILALVTGIALGFSRTQLNHLGMGALMHDIGKLKIPDSIMNKPGKLTDEEFAIMQQHPKFGFEILRKQDDVSLLSAHMALEHHERFDGNGYPNQLAKDDIHLFSRICSVADVFDAVTADRVYRKAFAPHEAYELLAASGGSHFDYKVVSIFLRNIAAYPVGTWVELNTGEIGIVTDTKPGFATRPKVRLELSPGDVREPIFPPQEINLAAELDRLIVRVVPREEIEQITGPILKVGGNRVK
jgi:HD-GYP domain-containing protein (c-di-GMP phosphodiesterase class II)